MSVSPRKILEICSGPGLFSQAMDPDEVDEVECVELSGESLSLILSLPSFPSSSLELAHSARLVPTDSPTFFSYRAHPDERSRIQV